MANVYALGAVKPWVKQAANEVGNRFGVQTIYGVGSRETANSDHPKGLALDFMCDSAQGDQISSFLQANYAIYNITYIIWKQRIWNVSRASEGWRQMEDRGSPTANHFDHVHASFQAKITIRQTDDGGLNILPGITVPDPLAGIKETLDGIKKVGDFVTNGHNWMRVGMFTLGVILILEAAVLLTGLSPLSVGGTVAKTLKKGAKNG